MKPRARAAKPALRLAPPPLPRLGTPWPCFEASSLGFAPGRLALLAGRTAHGKSALLLNLLAHWAGLRPGQRLLYYSLEMSEAQLRDRLQGLAGDRLAALLPAITLAYRPFTGSGALYDEALAAGRKAAVAAVFVDPLSFAGEDPALSARRLKALAVALACPVLAAVPARRIAPAEDPARLRELLSAGVDYNDNEVGDAIRKRRPRLEHLPHPALEQEADLVLSLLSHLADYKEEQDPDHRLVFPVRHTGSIEVSALKNRWGSLETVELELDDRSGLVRDAG